MNNCVLHTLLCGIKDNVENVGIWIWGENQAEELKGAGPRDTTGPHAIQGLCPVQSLSCKTDLAE